MARRPGSVRFSAGASCASPGVRSRLRGEVDRSGKVSPVHSCEPPREATRGPVTIRWLPRGSAAKRVRSRCLAGRAREVRELWIGYNARSTYAAAIDLHHQLTPSSVIR